MAGALPMCQLPLTRGLPAAPCRVRAGLAGFCLKVGSVQPSSPQANRNHTQPARACSVFVDTCGREVTVRRPVEYDEVGWPRQTGDTRVAVKKGQAVTLTTDPAAACTDSLFPITDPGGCCLVLWHAWCCGLCEGGASCCGARDRHRGWLWRRPAAGCCVITPCAHPHPPCRRRRLPSGGQPRRPPADRALPGHRRRRRLAVPLGAPRCAALWCLLPCALGVVWRRCCWRCHCHAFRPTTAVSASASSGAQLAPSPCAAPPCQVEVTARAASHRHTGSDHIHSSNPAPPALAPPAPGGRHQREQRDVHRAERRHAGRPAVRHGARAVVAAGRGRARVVTRAIAGGLVV